MNILFITPKFPPQVGGAASYFDILTQEFGDSSAIASQVVLTEQVKGEKLLEDLGQIKVFRVLPPRFQGSQRSKIKKIFLVFIFQLFSIFLLPLLVLYYRIQILHVHSTLTRIGGRYRNILFEFVLRALPVKVVLDVRDKGSIPKKSYFFSHAICVSKSIHSKLGDIVQNGQLTLVPIPLEEKIMSGVIDNEMAPESFSYEDLTPYISYIGDIHRDKGIYELLDAYEKSDFFQSEGYSLVFVGYDHEGPKFTRRIDEIQGAVYLGPVSHDLALSIIDKANSVILPSHSEGLPRVCLEAIALDTPVVLPPGIPEFQESCSPWVLENVAGPEIIDKLKFCLSSNDFPNYDLTIHDPEKVADKTLQIYSSLL